MSEAADARDVLARTLWGEARGEGRRGMHAVANVVLRRAAFPRWWGRDIVSVCRAPWQFSVWNPDDVNLPKLMAVDERDPQFRTALEVADRAIGGMLEDITNGADHYHTHAVAPLWSQGQTPVAIHGNHRFFRLAT